jgi:hypothetical protein
VSAPRDRVNHEEALESERLGQLFVLKLGAGLKKCVVMLEFHVVILERHVDGWVLSSSRMPFRLALYFMDFMALYKVRAQKASSNAFPRKAGSWPTNVDHPGSASEVVANLMKRQR